jgi:flavin-dependent dehydrogenase
MKYKYDVLVVGSGTAGIFFAKKMADNGFSVLVIDKLDSSEVGNRLNIFHIDKVKFTEFNVPEPKPGDDDYVNTFDVSYSKSAFDKHQKSTNYPFVVSLLPKFLKRLKK